MKEREEHLQSVEPGRVALELAFNEMYRAEMAYTRSKLRRLGVRERDVPDLGHELFLVAWTKLRTYDPQRRVRPWLGGIARKLASDYRRKAEHVRTSILDDLSRVPENDGERRDAEDAVAALQMRALVRRAVQKLDRPRREVVEMHDLRELPIETVAQRQGVPVPTAWSRLQSARKIVGLAMKRSAAADRARDPSGSYGCHQLPDMAIMASSLSVSSK